MTPPRHAAAVLAGAVLAAVAGGCGDATLSRDESVRALMAQNRELQDQLLAAEDRIAALTADGAEPTPRPRAPEDPYRALAVRFAGPTGPVDEDPAPGPERLHVVLEPLDADGDVVKRAGRLRLEALRPGGDGQDPTSYHIWTFSQDDLAQTWVDALGVRGYVLTLRWPGDRPPEGEALLLRAAFTTLAAETLRAERRVPLAPEG
ncbi:MAG: hypothetical protein R6X20_18455 [Phycisphaerae bacterium]